VIAHRFGYAPVFGAAVLNGIHVRGHRCDNALCQRIGPSHVQAFSHALNRRAYLAQRFVAGNPLGMPLVPRVGPGSCVTCPGRTRQR